MTTRYKAVSYGLGPIGALIARVALSRTDEIEVVGAVDINPALLGRDLSEAVGLEDAVGVRVVSSMKDIHRDADIVLHATSSFLEATMPQLIECCERGLDIVSTNEELCYPWHTHSKEANLLDSYAKKNNVTILGTGVNPGFVMDALAITLTGVCKEVREIKATRILDASKRRLPFQRKVGIGLTQAEFEDNVASGRFGHIGLPESIAMVCDALGLKVDRIEQRITPKIASESIHTEHFGIVERGKVIGLVQDAEGYVDGKRVATYHIEMYAGATDPHDMIELLGEPNLSLLIPAGTPGDLATAAVVVNSIPRVIESKPGLMTAKDLRPASSVLKL